MDEYLAEKKSLSELGERHYWLHQEINRVSEEWLEKRKATKHRLKKLYMPKQQVFSNLYKYAILVSMPYGFMDPSTHSLFTTDRELELEIRKHCTKGAEMALSSFDNVTYLKSTGRMRSTLCINDVLIVQGFHVSGSGTKVWRLTHFTSIQIDTERRNGDIRRRRAASVIQSAVREFLWRPIYPSGRTGYHARRGYEGLTNALSDNIVTNEQPM